MAAPMRGSIFDRKQLLDVALSTQLRGAVSIIEQACAYFNIDLVYIARPELFTHGQSLEWLFQKLGSIRDHLCISDGATIRVIPEMRNHVFFYCQDRSADVDALAQLEKRIPELFFGLSSQVNSAFRFRHGQKTNTPQSIVIPACAVPRDDGCKYYQFYLPPHFLEEKYEIFLANSSANKLSLQAKHLTYIPVTDASLDDRSFTKRLALAVAHSFFDPKQAVVIRLPPSERTATLASRVGPILRAIIHTDVLVPPVPAERVAFATGDADLDYLRTCSQSIDVIAHDTFDFWRHTHDFYAALHEFRVVARRAHHNPTVYKEMLTALCGRPPNIAWSTRTRLYEQF